jgi:adenosine deaminase
MQPLHEVIASMPKAELHMHLEGSIEPELTFALAERNCVSIPYRSVEELRAAYRFTSLQSFLDVYYAGCNVLVTERDFYELALAYLQRVRLDNVVHAEVFVSPQAHTRRGVPFEVVIQGVDEALREGERHLGLSTRLILGFQRQFGEDEAVAIVEQTLRWRDRIAGFGLGGPELGNPPAKFARVFGRCRELGFKVVAHAGEEAPAPYVAETVDVLKVDRIDHGVRCEEDPVLVARLAALQVPLTVCPLSNVKLAVFPDLASHNLKRLLRAGLMVTVNSDDPSYFGGYVNDNFLACQQSLDLTREDVHRLAKNSFLAAFLPDGEKRRYCAMLDQHFQ